MFGLVDAYAQGVSPPKNGGLVSDPNPIKLILDAVAASISGTFVAPAAGLYQFVLHGGGGTGSDNQSGGPGGLAIRTVRLARNANVPYTVARAALGGVTGASSTVNFADRTMTVTGAGSGNDDDALNGAGGTATGGDINVNGTSSTQAASYGPFVGGTQTGGGGVNSQQGVPGAPGTPGNGALISGGGGRLIVVYIGP